MQARASKHVEVAGCVAGTSDVDDVMLPSVNEAIQQPAQVGGGSYTRQQLHDILVRQLKLKLRDAAHVIVSIGTAAATIPVQIML